MLTELERYRGCLLGLACGDALGTTVEFSPRGSFTPLTEMVGGGPFGLPPGAWTDDCSMALCLAHSLLYRQGFDAVDQMNRYCNWANHGYLSSVGHCFDIGMTIARALERYQNTGDPYSGSPDPGTAGNGCLMRLAPVAMYYRDDQAQLLHFAGESARTTHGAEEAIESTRYFALLLRRALTGVDKKELLFHTAYTAYTPKVRAIVAGDWHDKYVSAIHGGGYVIDSLEAALWCFWQAEDYRSAVLMAANLGDDADTTAAICGQLAGAYYGVEAIPANWRELLFMREDITLLADRLLAERMPSRRVAAEAP